MSNHKTLQCVGNSVKGPCGWKGSLRSRSVYCPECGGRTKKIRTDIGGSVTPKVTKKIEKECAGKGSRPPCGWKGNIRGLFCPNCGGRLRKYLEKSTPVTPTVEPPVDEQPVEQNIVDIDTETEKVEINDTEHPVEREVPTENT